MFCSMNGKQMRWKEKHLCHYFVGVEAELDGEGGEGVMVKVNVD